MRIFNATSSWLCWLVVVYYWCAAIFLRVMNTFPARGIEPERATNTLQLFGICAAVMTVFAAILYALRRRFWYRRRQAPGFGFWVVTVLLYVCILLTLLSGFASYTLVGHWGALQWAALAVSGVFLVLCFPRLPAKPTGNP